MTNFEHFYSRYGLALVMLEKNTDTFESLEPKDFYDLLEIGLNHFQLKVEEKIMEKASASFHYNRIPKEKGQAARGIFLSPTNISKDLNAADLWKKIEEFQLLLKQDNIDNFTKNEAVQQSYAPTAGEFNNGKASKQSAKVTWIEAVCCAITTVSPDKPALVQVYTKDKKPSYTNTAIIPDLSIADLKQFISVFKRVSKFKSENQLIGKVKQREAKGKLEQIIRRPTIFNGNFPNAPQSHLLSALGLLGAIGEWAKEEDDLNLAPKVMASLENCPIYIINQDRTQVTTFNHFIVTLAREGKLNSIIDNIYRIQPYITFKTTKNDDWDLVNRERERVAFVASRFLHIFDEMAFREFLAIRAEYPYQLEILFKTYFMDKKQIDPRIVQSARYLGSWLNYVAYKVSTNEKPDNAKEMKAKVLVELESSAFSAKSGAALISQTITRAGRMSQMDAPAEAALFIEKTISGELGLKDAQQMLMAFARLRNKFEPKTTVSSNEEKNLESDEELEDFSDAQDNG